MEKVSIILPVYGVENYISRCIQSLINQTYENLEIILVNDASPDASGEIIDQFALIDKRIIHIKRQNGGVSAARNTGLDVATGDYILFVDSDDAIPLDAIEKMKDALYNQQADVIIGSYKRIYEETKESFLQKRYKFQRGHPFTNSSKTIFECPEILIDTAPAPWGKLFKREIIDESMRFAEGYWYEDLHYFLLYSPRFGKIGYIEDNIYNYYVRPGSIMTTNNEKIFIIFDIFSEVFEYYKDENILDDFQDELDFLMINHVLIGSFYRIAKARGIKKFSSMKKVVQFCKQQSPNYTKTKYLRNENLFIKLFVQLTKIVF